MDRFRALRSTVAAAAVAALAAIATPACVRMIEVEGFGFAERIRPDRRPLTVAQRTRDPRWGTYSDGSGAPGAQPGGELVSEIFIANVDRQMNNLPLSNCLWIASDAGGGAGDTLAMSWEAIGLISAEDQQEDGLPPWIRFCRGADPDQEAVFGASSQSLMGGDIVLPPIIASTDNPRILDRDIQATGVLLTAHGPAQPDPYGRCPVNTYGGGEIGYEEDYPGYSGQSIVTDGQAAYYHETAGLHVPAESGFDCVVDAANPCSTTVCGDRCTYRPSLAAGDALSFRLGTVQELVDGELDIVVQSAGFDLERWMRPNVMVVRERRSLARPMKPVAGTFRYAWSTPAGGGGPAGPRWHENFSPNLVVEEVRVFVRRPDGTEVPPPATVGDRVELVGENGATWACERHPDTGTFGIESCLAGGASSGLAATPTYVIEQLDPDFGNPLTAPLRWEAGFVSDPLAGPGGQLYIEFTLRAEFGEAGLSGRPLVADFGDVLVGDRKALWAEFVNVGGKTLEIDDVWIEGPDRAEFAFEIPIQPRAVPLPIDLIEEKEHVYALGVGEDFEEIGLLSTWEDPEQQLTVYRPAEIEGQALQLYGSQVEVRNELLFADPEAKFAFEAPASNVTRPLARTVYSTIQPPFALAVGDRIRIAASAHPQSYSSHDKEAILFVRAHPISSPGEELVVGVPLVARTAWGADPEMLPTRVVFHSSVRNVLIENVGDQPTWRRDVTLSGPDAQMYWIANQIPPMRLLEPGDAEVITLEYQNPDGPDCPPQPTIREATLTVTTDAGDLEAELLGGCSL